MIEIIVRMGNGQVNIKKFDGTVETITTNDNYKYWDVIAEYCECADKVGLVPDIKIIQ
nr:MAG TPA: hypothetical protein [Caudoviricetes sp.]